MAFDDLIWKIWEIEEEIREKQLQEEELKQRLRELGASHRVKGETVDNVDLAGQPYMVVDRIAHPWTHILAGELHRCLMYKALRWRKETPSAFAEMTKKALQDLNDKKFITESDFKMLSLLLEPSASHKVAQDVYQKILDSKDTSQLALSLSNIALHSYLDALSASEGETKRARGIASSDVGGAIGGAAAGSKWGWIGALIGGIIGGAALSIATALEEDDGGDDGD
jgi:hypothetical protein